MNFHDTPNPIRRRSGFSIMELMGVMTIMGLLTLALLPSLISQYDKEARNREAKSIERLAEGLTQYVLRTRSVPGPTEFVSAIATQLGMHTNEVIFTERGGSRIILIDPAITNRLTLPYTQTFKGNTNNLGNNLGVIIVSSVGASLPSNLTNGFASSTTLFQAFWNSAEGQIPSGLVFAGSGDDLRVQRVNLATLFVPLVLNYDTTTPEIADMGRFTIDASTTNALPITPVWVSSYIKGTVLGLHDSQAVATNSLQAREILQNPMSYVFQNQNWRGSLLIGPEVATDPTPSDVQTAIDDFVGAPSNGNAQGNPQSIPDEVVHTFIIFVTNYVTWADNGFPSSGSVQAGVTNSQHDLDDVTEDLVHTPTIPDNDTDPDGDGYGDNADPPSGPHDSDHDGFCDHSGCDHSDCDHDDDHNGHCDDDDHDGWDDHDGDHDGWNNSDHSDHDCDRDGWDDHDTDHNGVCDRSPGGWGNNGHGNNTDGVDSSNPGNGGGGPNGGYDPSGGYDDERGYTGYRRTKRNGGCRH